LIDDPLTTLETAALNDGVKFVFEQLTGLLTRMRERRRQRAEASGSDQGEMMVAEIEHPALDGTVRPSRLVAAELEQAAPRILELRRLLTDYIDGLAAIDTADLSLRQTVDEGRRLLELLLGQQITFRGEDAPRTGTAIDARVRAELVEGYVAAVRVKSLKADGSPDTLISAQLEVGTVAPGGLAIGVDAETVGDVGPS
jgi:hypothetical protein